MILLCLEGGRSWMDSLEFEDEDGEGIVDRTRG